MLPQSGLQLQLSKPSSFTGIDACSSKFKEVLENKKDLKITILINNIQLHTVTNDSGCIFERDNVLEPETSFVSETKSCRWKQFCRMIVERTAAVCAVLEENIVVCGGFDQNSDRLKTVESLNV